LDINTVMIVLSTLFAVSEALSIIPQVRSNGIFQIVFNVLKVLSEKHIKKREKSDES